MLSFPKWYDGRIRMENTNKPREQSTPKTGASKSFHLPHFHLDFFQINHSVYLIVKTYYVHGTVKSCIEKLRVTYVSDSLKGVF